MQIHNKFDVPMAPAEAWSYLMSNIPETVPCFPGAELVEKIDDDNYKARVTVKLGPVAMVFTGKLRIEARDDGARTGSVKASWSENKGRGNATTATRFAMRGEGEGTAVELDTDVQLAGQVAQYGRGAGVIADISAQLVSKFAENLRATIDAHARGDSAVDMPHKDISGLGLLGRAVANRFKRDSD